MSTLQWSAIAAKTNNFWYEYNEADAAIVFVHGIFSDSRSCWLHTEGQERQFWPDLVRTDPRLKGLPIYMGGFYTAIDSGIYDLRACSDELFGAMDRRDEHNHRTVLSRKTLIFVCHSTGGLVVRYTITDNIAAFCDKNIGLILIASPSYGSTYANSLSGLANYFNNKLGKQLQFANESLRDLDFRFKKLLHTKQFPGLDGVEGYENHFIIHRKFFAPWPAVVDKESAGRYFGDPKLLRETNHFTSVKPHSWNHPSHELLIDFVAKNKDCFGLQASIASPEQPPPQATLLPTPKTLLVENLAGIETLNELSNRLRRDQFVGRREEQQAFRIAVEKMAELHKTGNRDSRIFTRVFLLHGEGGMGKTSLLSQYEKIAQDVWPDGLLHIAIDFNLISRKLQSSQEIMKQIADELLSEHEPELRTFRDLYSLIHAIKVKIEFSSKRATVPTKNEVGEKAAYAVHQEIQRGLERREHCYEIEQELEGYLTPVELDTYRNRQLLLSKAFVSCIGKVAAKRPIFVIFDSCEAVKDYQTWFRDGLITHGSNKIIYALAGRDDQSEIYRQTLSEELLREVKLRKFSKLDIEDYLSSHGVMPPFESLLTQITNITRGIPLAVKALVSICRINGDLDNFNSIAQIPAENAECVVAEVTQRFLNYCLDKDSDGEEARRSKAEDRFLIYTLALLRKHNSRAYRDQILRAAWGERIRATTEEDIDSILNALGKRYSFVFGPSAAMNEVVQEFIQRALRDQSIPRGPLSYINDKITSFLGLRMSTFKGTAADVLSKDYQSYALDYINHWLWLDEEKSVRFLVDNYIKGLDLDREFSSSLLGCISEDARSHLTSDHRKILWALENLSSWIAKNYKEDAETERIEAILKTWLTREGRVLYLLRHVKQLSYGGKNALYLALKQLKEADELCKEFDDLLESRAEAFVRVGTALAFRGKDREAEACARRCLEFDSSNIQASLLLGRILCNAGKWKEATELYEEAIEKGTAISQIRSELDQIRGLLLRMTTNTDLAASSNPEAVTKALTALGNDLINRGYLEEAVKKFRLALTTKLFSPSTNLRLGHALRQLGIYKEAMDQFNVALSSRETNLKAQAYDGLGATSRQMGVLDEAVHFYKCALQINERYANARHGLGKSLLKQEHYLDAETQLKMALAENPKSPWILNSNGILQIARAQPKGAETFFKDSLHACSDLRAKGAPREYAIQLASAIALFGLREYAEGERAIKQSSLVCRAHGISKEFIDDLTILRDHTSDAEIGSAIEELREIMQDDARGGT
jgi:tetratricopeptide (TPR) repeat protein